MCARDNTDSSRHLDEGQFAEQEQGRHDEDWPPDRSYSPQPGKPAPVMPRLYRCRICGEEAARFSNRDPVPTCPNNHGPLDPVP